jgi:hypothetical protein
MIKIFEALITSIIAAEIYSWLPSLCDFILTLYSKLLPYQLRDRQLEEWRALLNDFPGNLAKLAVTLEFLPGLPKIVINSKRLVRANHALNLLITSWEDLYAETLNGGSVSYELDIAICWQFIKFMGGSNKVSQLTTTEILVEINLVKGKISMLHKVTMLID